MIINMDTVNALTFRQKFGEIIDRVVATGKPVVVQRQNKPVVVMYPYEMKREELEKINLKERKENVLALLDEWREKWGSKKLWGDKSSTEIIREMRDNRYGKRWWKTRTNY